MNHSILSSLSEHERASFIDGIFDLVRAGNDQALTEMLDAGVPVDLRNAREDSPLIIAAYAQHPAIVALLLDRGAQPDLVNSMGQTAISCAVFRNDGDILRMLLSAGANPDRGHRTGAEIATQFGLADMAAILAEFAAE